MRLSAFASIVFAGLVLMCGSSRAQVTIYRDSFGLPSVSGAALPDAIYGLGYAMARDNAVAMARNYKQARGRLSEVDGKSQLFTDGFLQSLGLEEAAAKKAAELTGEQAALIKSFCAGANKALSEERAQIPEWIEPFTPTDVLALAQLANCAFPLEDIASQLLPGMGSNQFAVGATRSATGHAILSADPHLLWSGPLLWYEFSLYSRDIRFHGITLNGLPFGVMGHTDKIAWCMTNNDPRLWALYTVTTSADHPGQYNFHGEWKDFENTKITLKYRENGVLKSQQQTAKRTLWGPMVPFRSQALHLSLVGVWDQLDESLRMARAQNAAQFRAALAPRGISMWNIVYADTKGSIGYQYNARVPKRDETFDWSKPVSGADPRTKWGDLWTLDELPHVENPKSDLLINANSTPWLTPQGDEIKPNAWPSYVTSYGPTTRYERIAAELSTDHRVSPQNAMRYATDTLVPDARRAISALPRRITGDTAADYAAALAVLRSWNGRADLEARGCALYLYWMLADKNMSGLVRKAASGTAWTTGETSAAEAALLAAAGRMKKQYGKLDVAWGEVHVSRRGSAEIPVTGLGYFLPGDKTATVTPNFGPLTNGKINCIGGSSFRMIVDLDPAGVHSWSILPYGDSQDPANPHYADQMTFFGRGEYKDTLFGLNRIKREATSKLELRIGKQ